MASRSPAAICEKSASIVGSGRSGVRGKTPEGASHPAKNDRKNKHGIDERIVRSAYYRTGVFVIDLLRCRATYVWAFGCASCAPQKSERRPKRKAEDQSGLGAMRTDNAAIGSRSDVGNAQPAQPSCGDPPRSG